MKEFASEWKEETVLEFMRFDTNTDGYISTKECLTAIKNNVLFGSAGGGSGSSSSGSSDSKSTASGSAPKLSREGLPADAEKRWVDWVEKNLVAKDANKSGSLTPNEWNASDGDFGKVDADKDGQITLAEYYLFKKPSKK